MIAVPFRSPIRSSKWPIRGELSAYTTENADTTAPTSSRLNPNSIWIVGISAASTIRSR